ncbi:MAG: AraC family transcriptional regulator [Bacteroidales bacterium]|nr:AraC family transcriptional regulator [Bacteroidales bacterium]
MDITKFNHFFHQPTFHPLVTIGDLARSDTSFYEERDWGMYCVILFDSVFGELRKDGNAIVYQPGSIITLLPGQSMSIKVDYTAKRKGWILAFRPELIIKTGLGRDFYMFDFFNYDFDKALTLDDREHGILTGCYENTFAELLQTPDYLTNHMIRLCIGRLLSYCKRFYEQRYAIRNSAKYNLGHTLETMIDSYLSSGSAAQQGTPNVSWAADQFNLSPNYFGSLVKKELHISAKDFIQGKIINAAEKLLSTTEMPISEIAEELGFSHSNHFTRFFTSKTGTSPLKYRKGLNK